MAAADIDRLVGAPDTIHDSIADLFRVGGEANVTADMAAAVAGTDALVDLTPVCRISMLGCSFDWAPLFQFWLFVQGEAVPRGLPFVCTIVKCSDVR